MINAHSVISTFETIALNALTGVELKPALSIAGSTRTEEERLLLLTFMRYQVSISIHIEILKKREGRPYVQFPLV
jgi:hypothetical protein